MPSNHQRPLFTLILLVCVCLTTLPAFAATISYQGRLTDDLGASLSGPVDLIFSIYDNPDAGTQLWKEAQSVMAEEGIFNTFLGSTTPFPEGLFEQEPLFLEISVGAEVLTPRQPITATALAMVAGTCKGLTVGALTTTMIADQAVTADQIADGTVTAVKIAGGFVPNLDADLLDGHDTTHFATADSVTALQNQVATLQSQVNTLVALLTNVSRPDADTIRFSNVNVQIVNGSGFTGVANGTGNLIVGYNELRGGDDDRSGSHNIVTGTMNNYSSYGGLVAGVSNTINGAYAVISGGSNNDATGDFATVSGGGGNLASGNLASVSGGRGNWAVGLYASANGGWNNIASGDYSLAAGGGGEDGSYLNEAFAHYSVVVGGQRNFAGDPSLSDHAIGQCALVSGGNENVASGSYATVGGGSLNEASGDYASVSGGGNNVASSDYASVSAGENNTANGDYASVSGGGNNVAYGALASVSGGSHNSATGPYTSVSGGGGDTQDRGNIAFGRFSSVLGGSRNIAGDTTLTDSDIGIGTSISGGDLNKATGSYANVSGGLDNTAGGYISSIGGGYSNVALNNYSGVSGGANNSATGRFSQIGGGDQTTASGDFDWAAGSLWEDN